MNPMVVARPLDLVHPFQRALIWEPKQVSALSAEGLGIVGVTAHSQPRKKESALWHAGKTAESLSLLQELNPASNGISKLSAKIITDHLITSAPPVDLKTTHSPHVNVSNYEKIVTHLSADSFDTLLHCYKLLSWYPTLALDICNGFPLGELSQ